MVSPCRAGARCPAGPRTYSGRRAGHQRGRGIRRFFTDGRAALAARRQSPSRTPLGRASPGTPSLPRDRPSAAALIDAVGVSLDGVDQPDERLRLHARVAASVLRIARRELLLGDTRSVAHRERLRDLGFATDSDLAVGIRTGKFDGRMAEVIAAVRVSHRQSDGRQPELPSPPRLRSPGGRRS